MFLELEATGFNLYHSGVMRCNTAYCFILLLCSMKRRILLSRFSGLVPCIISVPVQDRTYPLKGIASCVFCCTILVMLQKTLAPQGGRNTLQSRLFSKNHYGRLLNGINTKRQIL